MNTIQRMKHIRIEQGISQEELAERVNVSRQTISKWENGLVCPTGDNLHQLGKVLGVPVDALLNDGWTPPEPQVVEVPVPRPRNYRLWALLAALVLAAGILIGALFFREQGKKPLLESEMQSEVIGPSTVGGYVPLLPLE